MVKLLRFKYTDSINPGQVVVHGQDVRGFGKQPITIAPYSRIALKNYNIKLVDKLSYMIFTVAYDDEIIFRIIGDGSLEQNIGLPAGMYTAEELIYQLQLAINSLTGQNTVNASRGYDTYVTLQKPEAQLSFSTTVYPADVYDISNEQNMSTIIQDPNPVIKVNDIYNCTNASTSSKSIMNNGLDLQVKGKLMIGGDTFSFTINNLGIDPISGRPTSSFYFSSSLYGDINNVSLWGIAFVKGEYHYANNSTGITRWNVITPTQGPRIVPTVNDIVQVVRSGTRLTITIVRAGNVLITKIVNISLSVFKGVDPTKYNYVINTEGPIIVSNLTYAMSSFTDDTPLETTLQCPSVSLGQQLGFPNTEVIESNVGTPAVITLEQVAGGVNYEGIMVCINGLDLETYDFATAAEGKTNFLYTIQKEPDDNLDFNITSSSGNLSNEPYIDMNNQGAMNINNKLSIYFLDTASGRKLEFSYADLLVIIK